MATEKKWCENSSQPYESSNFLPSKADLTVYARQTARSPSVDWLVIFGQLDNPPKAFLRGPGIFESLPEQMPFEIEGLGKIWYLIEQSIHQGKSLVKISLPF